MMKTKKKIKEFGNVLQNSGDEHKKRLRTMLLQETQKEGDVEHVSTRKKGWMLLPLGAFAVFLLVTVIQLPQNSGNVFVTRSQGIVPIGGDESAIPELREEFMDMDQAGEMEAYGMLSSYYPMPDLPPYYPVDDISDDEITDFVDENGTLLEQVKKFDLLIKDERIEADVQASIEALGGHVRSIQSRTDTYVIVSGFVPVESIARFRQDLEGFVPSEAFIKESVQAQDLVPTVLRIDTQIEDLEEQLNEATQRDKEAIEDRIEELKEVRRDQLDRVDYVEVTVNIEVIRSFLRSTNYDDIEQSFMGFDEPGLLQQLGLNILFLFVFAILVLSYTFWFWIPVLIGLAIWFRKRRLRKKME